MDFDGHMVAYIFWKIVFVSISNYNIESAVYGGGGTVGNILKPPSPINTLVHLTGHGIANLSIDTEGNITLYSEDLSSYLSGKIIGTFCYILP